MSEINVGVFGRLFFSAINRRKHSAQEHFLAKLQKNNKQMKFLLHSRHDVFYSCRIRSESPTGGFSGSATATILATCIEAP